MQRRPSSHEDCGAPGADAQTRLQGAPDRPPRQLDRRSLGFLGTAWAAGALWPGRTSAVPVAPAAAPTESPPLLLRTYVDGAARMTTPVRINDKGPFGFVVDTGADRTVIAEPVATALGLPPGEAVMLQALGGAALTPTVRIDSLKVGDVRLRRAELPVVPVDRLGVDGLLGVDALDERNVTLDFNAKRLQIRRSVVLPNLNHRSGEVSVAADTIHGRLTIADARVDGILVAAFVDSGSGCSIGNLALAEALARRDRLPPALGPPVQLVGLTDDPIMGQVRLVRHIRLGDLTLSGAPIVFTDVHIFNVLKLDARPSLLLGVDALKLFPRVELDFGGGRVRFRVDA